METMISPGAVGQSVVPVSAARTLINTIPKAGTHLLEKVVRLLPGSQAAELHLELFALPSAQFAADQSSAGTTGATQFQEVPLSDLSHALGGITPGYYATGHLFYSQSLAALLAQMSIKVLYILRDPRDIAVSFTKYVAQIETHYLFGDYHNCSEVDQLMMTIVGITDVRLSDAVPYLPRLMDIGQMMSRFLPWTKQPNVYTTYFEQLVGPAGGGTRANQIAEIGNIAQHLGIRCSQRQVEAIADQLFGNTATFRKGLIGDWRNHFTPEHKRAFKVVAGQLLIDLGYEQGLNW
jgi:sulfotransferase 6B1